MGGDFLAKPLDPEGPPPAGETLLTHILSPLEQGTNNHLTLELIVQLENWTKTIDKTT